MVTKTTDRPTTFYGHPTKHYFHYPEFIFALSSIFYGNFLTITCGAKKYRFRVFFFITSTFIEIGNDTCYVKYVFFLSLQLQKENAANHTQKKLSKKVAKIPLKSFYCLCFHSIHNFCPLHSGYWPHKSRNSYHAHMGRVRYGL